MRIFSLRATSSSNSPYRGAALQLISRKLLKSKEETSGLLLRRTITGGATSDLVILNNSEASFEIELLHYICRDPKLWSYEAAEPLSKCMVGRKEA